MWRRLTAILPQLRSKQATDRRLLADVIEPSIGERAFFLHKGIGRARRVFSKTDPDWVIGFITTHSGLSGLSRRDALKHMERQRR